MIESIEVRNFRNYSKASFSLSARTLFLGPNGSGKSTIVQDAIAWCILGRCWGVNAKGEGQKDLIRRGADSARVDVNLGNGWVVSRTISRNGSNSSSMKTEQILGRLGVTEGMLLAVIYGQTFFMDMHHSDAKAMLMQALNVRVPKADLPGVDLGDRLEVGLDELEMLYQAAFDNRKDLKKQLANVKVPDRPKVVDINLAGKTVDDLAATVREDRTTTERLVREQATADQELEARQTAIQKAEDAAGNQATVLGTKTAHENMLTKARGDLAKGQADLEAAEAMTADPVDQLAVQINELDVLIGKLGNHDPDRGCVLSSAIPCLTKATEFTNQIGTLKEMAKGLAKRQADGQRRQAAIQAAQQTIRDAERDVTYHEGQIAAADQKLEDAKTAAATLKSLKAGLAGLKKKAQAASVAVQAHRVMADRTMAQWQTMVQAEGQRLAYDKAVKERDGLTKDVADAEAMVELLGPGGVRLKVLATALDKFSKDISQALEPFGFTMTFSADPWQVLVDTPEGEGIRFEMLSKGQRLWTALAFQMSLAKMAGLTFAVIDDIESVVGKHRGILTEAVMTSDLDQVLVAMAKPDEEAAPKMQGLQIVRVTEANLAAV